MKSRFRGMIEMILSIDWDYFVPEIDDLGNIENAFFLDAVWHTRGYCIDSMLTNGHEVGFWEKIRGIVDIQTTEINVSESHLSAYRLVELATEPLILVDAHHDCWPFKFSKRQIDCANWVSAWIRQAHSIGVERHVIWVTPYELPQLAFSFAAGNSSLKSEIQEEVRNNITIITLDELANYIDNRTINTIHACRSGCWTPPWLDKKWLAFLESSQLEIKAMDSEPWDGLRERWTEVDLQNAIGVDKRIKEWQKDLICVEERK